MIPMKLFTLLLIAFFLSPACAFAQSWTVTATALGHGTVDPVSQTVSEGATTTITVMPDTGYLLAGVDGGACGATDNGDGTWTTDMIFADCGITATFVLSAGDVVSQGDFDSDIVAIDNFNVPIAATILGTSINWINGTTCNGTNTDPCSNDYQLRLSSSFFVQAHFYLVPRFPESTPSDAYGLVTDVTGDAAMWLVLASGDSVGPQSTFDYPTSPASAANWRADDGVDGYFGFRLFNPVSGKVNYGYAHLVTSGYQPPAPLSGFPATIIGYAFNRRGDAIVIP
jgi:hypothetical protein